MENIQPSQKNALDILADNIINNYNLDDIEELLSEVDYSDYENDPVGFCEDVLKQSLTDDVKVMLNSILTNRLTVAVSANATGKTHGAACAAIWFKKCRKEAIVITAAAPPAERNLKSKLWGEIRTQIKLSPKVFEKDRITSLKIVDSEYPRSYIEGVSIPTSGSEDEREAKFSGIHAPNLFFVLDEGDAIPDEIYRAIESCMSGGFNRMLVMFNPKRKLGAVYRMIRDGRCNIVTMKAFDHPNVLTGEEIILGAVTREQTVVRINEWTEPLEEDVDPDASCYEVPDFLVGCVAKNDRGIEYPPLEGGWRRIKGEHPEFNYMVLGQYPAQSAFQLISYEWIENARTRWDAYVAEFGRKPPVGVEPIMGLDSADLGEDFNSLCIRYGGWIKEIRVWNGIDVYRTANIAANYYHKEKGVAVLVDATGVGAGVAPNINGKYRFECGKCEYFDPEPAKGYKEEIKCPKCEHPLTPVFSNAKRVMVASKPTEKTELGEFFQLRDQLWWSVREWLRTDSGAMLPPDEKLCEELAVPEYEIMNGKIKIMPKPKMREELGRSPDRADALCLTFASNSRPRVRLM